MASSKLKVSLIVASVVVLVLAGVSFLVGTETPTDNSVVNNTVSTARLIVDFGDGEIKHFKLEPHGENLFLLMKGKLSEEGIDVAYETFTGLGELITRIGDKKGGDGGKYWQYWINGNYAQVGASSYVPKAGDIIEWRFTDEKQ